MPLPLPLPLSMPVSVKRFQWTGLILVGLIFIFVDAKLRGQGTRQESDLVEPRHLPSSKSSQAQDDGSTEPTMEPSGYDRSISTTTLTDSVEASGALIPGLIQTNFQPMFETIVPNLLDPSFRYHYDDEINFVAVEICKAQDHVTGLVNSQNNNQPLTTSIYGYREARSDLCTWPGHTFEIQAHTTYSVRWLNKIPIEEYLITSLDGTPVVDTTIHWAYSLPGYSNYSISTDGVPIVPHYHGGHNGFKSDGRSEAFFTPDYEITGPEWSGEVYQYYQEHAGTGWYHDHALGLTRLNVYAGLAGFFLTRDDQDTGKPDNPLLLPAFPYEVPLAVQDRMFKEDGSFFYPAFPGDPAYEGFIVESGVVLPEDIFPNGGPTMLAEFFGDVMLVNGKIWPKLQVEPRNYRLRLLNSCDSRFLIVQFVQVRLGETEIPVSAATLLPFYIVGAEGGLSWLSKPTDTLVVEPAAVYDVIFNFAPFDGYRIIMKNIGPDEPFTGYFDPSPPPRQGTTFLRTDRIMAFDVVMPLDSNIPDSFDPSALVGSTSSAMLGQTDPMLTRRVGLFEGSDALGRILPLLGTVDPAADCDGNPVNWPDEDMYRQAGLAGQQMVGTSTWHSPTTENIKLGSVEEWEIWNFSEDAHPFHMHLVSFEILGRNLIVWDSKTTDEDRFLDDPARASGDGAFLVEQPVVMHDGSIGKGVRVINPTKGQTVSTPPAYFEDAPKNMVITPPGQITRIKAHFDKDGSYTWHCHILSHEDHAMMRRYDVCSGSE